MYRRAFKEANSSFDLSEFAPHLVEHKSDSTKVKRIFQGWKGGGGGGGVKKGSKGCVSEKEKEREK